MKYLLIIVIIILSSCSSHEPPVLVGKGSDIPQLELETKKEPLPPEFFIPFKNQESPIEIGDELEISVFGQDSTEAKVRVAPDGYLYYLFGIKVKAVDRLVVDIAQDIKLKLNKMFNNPEVSVLPVLVRNNEFSLIGKVRTPGQYKLTTSLTLRQAITQAGGLRDGVFRGTTVKIASLKKSFIIRDNKRIPVDFHALLQDGDTSQNIFVHPGDYIYIASGLAQEVYILGAVTDPHPAAYNDNMTIVSLLSEHGRGFTKDAYIKQIVVLRGDLEKPQAYQLNLQDILEGKSHDIYLQPGDIVYIPTKPYKFAAELFRMAMHVFAATIGGRAGNHVADGLFPRE